MSGRYGYEAECLSNAVAVLVTDVGPIRERLYAARKHLFAAREDNFPEGDLRKRYCQLLDPLKKAQPVLRTEKRMKMTDKAAVRIAREIWNLHHAMEVFVEEEKREREEEVRR